MGLNNFTKKIIGALMALHRETWSRLAGSPRTRHAWPSSWLNAASASYQAVWPPRWLLINFNVKLLKSDISSLVNELPE